MGAPFLPGKGVASKLWLLKDGAQQVLATVLLHVVKASGPVDIQASLDPLVDRGSGVVDMASADPLHVFDLNRLVDGAVIAGLSTSLGKEDYLKKCMEYARSKC